MKENDMVICDRCKVIGKPARPLYLYVGLQNPPNTTKGVSYKPFIERDEFKDIDLCDDCCKILAEGVLIQFKAFIGTS